MIVGFNGKKISLIEIICIIVILVVLIAMAVSGISSLIGKDDGDMWEQREDILIAEAEEYYLKNSKDDLVYGDNFNIKLSELEKNNYLHDKFPNSCIDNSYVSVYKDIDGNYVYIPTIKCSSNDYISKTLYPVINTSLNDNSLLIDIRDSSNNQKVLLYDCTIKIYNDDEELLNNDFLDINLNEFRKTLNLKEYDEDISKLRVVVMARNNIGFTSEITLKTNKM